MEGDGNDAPAPRRPRPGGSIRASRRETKCRECANSSRRARIRCGLWRIPPGSERRPRRLATSRPSAARFRAMADFDFKSFCANGLSLLDGHGTPLAMDEAVEQEI